MILKKSSSTETIRIMPSNYMLLVRQGGRYICDPDHAIPEEVCVEVFKTIRRESNAYGSPEYVIQELMKNSTITDYIFENWGGKIREIVILNFSYEIKLKSSEGFMICQFRREIQIESSGNGNDDRINAENIICKQIQGEIDNGTHGKKDIVFEYVLVNSYIHR